MKIAAFAPIAIGAAILAAGLNPTPAAAQRGERVLTIFGKDKCPQSQGEEIVVCQRLDERERYRIPEPLRGSPLPPSQMGWSDRAKSLEYVGRSGGRSCGNSGQDSWTGCWSQLMKQAKDERAGRATTQGDTQIP
ncbi:hypothetical protein PQ455_09640 [Sphingomonas naphthae]|uniref:Uncharacterized protein n=1 Tax=Sphingomonas naphthae TaxID=1813468 RepID=A0ABY7TG20_9SPHN|nr:hypothetical protein [Sphingomonas naphthae]WCT71916.1 hypothetical protein PQ455_09640 [Sphingomonas naphthae]